MKKSKPFFVSKVLPSNPSPRLEKFRGPVMVVKLTKGQKILKKFEKNCKFKKNLDKFQDINNLRTISLYQETIQYPCFKPEKVSLAQRSLRLEQKFSKNLKFKFYPDIAKTGVNKNLIIMPLTLETMKQLNIKPCRRSQGLCCKKKFENMKKLQIF